MVALSSPVEIQLPEKVYEVCQTKAKFIVLIGGRGSGKSESAARILTMWCQTEAADVLCGRELQNSIDESVHKLISTVIRNNNIEGFDIQANRINCLTGGGIRYKGLARNPDAVKSYAGFRYCWIEEAQSLSQDSISQLLPTIRSTNSQFVFTANPMSKADPFSKRFINPYIDEVRKNGIYRDELHLIILMNWRDNPWHSELEPQRIHDFENLPRALYDHIWEGDFNDSVENPLIKREWFDACIDAHKVLGFGPLGEITAAHDPSDTGDDPKAFVYRHGSIVMDAKSMHTGDINEGGSWASGLANNLQVDSFQWDCDGMGVGLNKQFSRAFKGKHTTLAQFKGSMSPVHPDEIFDSVELVLGQKTNKESFKNRRAQNYFLLRDRVLRTFKAVTENVYSDPDQLISFSSDITELDQLRTELSRIPIKPNANGMFDLYTKEIMKSKFKIDSPNLADATMMTMIPPINEEIEIMSIAPIKTMGGAVEKRYGRQSRLSSYYQR